MDDIYKKKTKIELFEIFRKSFPHTLCKVLSDSVTYSEVLNRPNSMPQFNLEQFLRRNKLNLRLRVIPNWLSLNHNLRENDHR